MIHHHQRYRSRVATWLPRPHVKLGFIAMLPVPKDLRESKTSKTLDDLTHIPGQKSLNTSSVSLRLNRYNQIEGREGFYQLDRLTNCNLCKRLVSPHWLCPRHIYAAFTKIAMLQEHGSKSRGIHPILAKVKSDFVVMLYILEHFTIY